MENNVQISGKSDLRQYAVGLCYMLPWSVIHTYPKGELTAKAVAGLYTTARL